MSQEHQENVVGEHGDSGVVNQVANTASEAAEHVKESAEHGLQNLSEQTPKIVEEVKDEIQKTETTPQESGIFQSVSSFAFTLFCLINRGNCCRR